MKILFLSNLYGENARGGAEGIVQQEAEALAARGYDVVVVAGQKSEKRDKPKSPHPYTFPSLVVRRYHPPNIYFYSDDHKHNIITRFVWHVIDTFNIWSALRFAKILKEEKPDIVHTHNLMGLGFLIPLIIRLAGVNHVHTLHDVQLLHPSGLIIKNQSISFFQKIYMFFTRILMNSPSVVISPSQFLLDFHTKNGFFSKSESVVLSNPVSNTIIASGAKQSRKNDTDCGLPRRFAPRNDGMMENETGFLFVGQIEKHKGVFTLLDAWEQAKIPHATLEIVGDGSVMEEVKKRTSTVANVTVHGKLNGDALGDAYKNASYVVVSSLVIENQPTVILEAFSYGVPVIASRIGGIPELVVEHETGWLVPPGDTQALAAALGKASECKKEKKIEMQIVVQEKIKEYSLEHHISALITVYEHHTEK